MIHILRYLFQLAAVTALAAAALALLLRIAGRETLTLGPRIVPLRWDAPCRGQSFTRAMALVASLWGLAYLAAVYAAAVLYCAVSGGSVTWEAVASALRRSDAVHYRNLAMLGYHGYIENGQHLFLVFFPLYPWCVRLLHGLIGGGYDLCAHLLSGTCFVAGCVVFARLMTEELGWEAARLGLGLLTAYPFSFFFAGVFTESLFFLLSVSTFYLLRRRRWLPAGLLGALAALTRMQGLVLAVPWLVQVWTDTRPLQKLRRREGRSLVRGLLRRLLPLAFMALGAGVYLALNWSVEGDPFRFAFYQRDHWFQYPVPLPACLGILWDTIAANGANAFTFTTLLPELIVFVLSAGTVLYAAGTLPLPWTAYLLGCLILNYSLSWPLSCGRYMACAFPLFTALALLLRRRPALGWSLPAAPLLQGAYLYAFLTGTSIY